MDIKINIVHILYIIMDKAIYLIFVYFHILINVHIY